MKVNPPSIFILQKLTAMAFIDMMAQDYSKALSRLSYAWLSSQDPDLYTPEFEELLNEPQRAFFKTSWTTFLQEADAKSTPEVKIQAIIEQFTTCALNASFAGDLPVILDAVLTVVKPESREKGQIDAAVEMVKNHALSKSFKVFDSGLRLLNRATDMAKTIASYTEKELVM